MKLNIHIDGDFQWNMFGLELSVHSMWRSTYELAPWIRFRAVIGPFSGQIMIEGEDRPDKWGDEEEP